MNKTLTALKFTTLWCTMVERYFAIIKTENEIHIKILASFSTFLIARNYTTGLAHTAKKNKTTWKLLQNHWGVAGNIST